MSPLQSALQRVLVVDDDSIMRDILAMLIDSEGRELRFAKSGEEAVDLLKTITTRETPAIVLMDLHMPGLAGGPLAARVREAVPPSTVLIAMSATEPAVLDAAFDAFLHKPFDAEGFDSAVDRAHDSRALATAPPTDSVVPALDECTYNTLLAIMPRAQLDDLYAMCLEDANGRTTRMIAAAQCGDSATYIQAAHAIKGSAGMLGISELHHLATRMEAEGLGSTFLLNDLALATARVRRMLDERR